MLDLYIGIHGEITITIFRILIGIILLISETVYCDNILWSVIWSMASGIYWRMLVGALRNNG